MAEETVKKVKNRGRKVPKKYESLKKEKEEVLEVEREGWWVYI